MTDSTPVIGMIGTGLSFTLGQWNDLVGLIAGVLTCGYMPVSYTHLTLPTSDLV